MRLNPSYKLLRHLEVAGLQWPEVEADLSKPESVTPVHGSEDRLRVAGRRYQGFGFPSVEDPTTLIVIAVRPRERAEQEAELQVVGRDTKRAIRRSHGGSGRRWPTTWDELADRIRAAGCTVDQGSKHMVVRRGSEMVDSLPCTSSDWRALLNACQQLRRRGVDVSR